MPINVLWGCEGRLTIAVYEVLGQSFGSYGCGVYQVVFDQFLFYFIFNPAPVYSLVGELVIGYEPYSLSLTVILYFLVNVENHWKPRVIGPREDRAVEYLSSRHCSLDVLQSPYDSV